MSAADIEAGHYPIWDMSSPRNSCVVPEQPLLITANEERDLNELSIGIWRTVENAIDIAQFSQMEPFRGLANAASVFPERLTMPPAIRADVVRTSEGFKIVEIDPITAISLGETALLANVWKEVGYSIIEAPTSAIVSKMREKNESVLSFSLPNSKSEYSNELGYLAQELKREGIDIVFDDVPSGKILSLSAFIEEPNRAKYINKGIKLTGNPLWGPLVRMNSKDYWATAIKSFDTRLKRFFPKTALPDDAEELFSDNESVVFKPIKSTGSKGIILSSAPRATNKKGYIIQEMLEVVPDSFGDSKSLEGDWISRISIYAGKSGLSGAQVTARKKEGTFTNAHGQADAIQTTIAIIA